MTMSPHTPGPGNGRDHSDTSEPAEQAPPSTQHGTESTRPSTSIARDDVFHLLQNGRRRAVLRYLLEHNERNRFRMRDMAEEIAAWEHDTTVDQLTSDERQRVYIALYQTHLPKLDAHGLIEYNQARGLVEPTPLLRVVKPFVADRLHTDCDRLTPDTTNDNGRRKNGVFASLFDR